MTHNYCAVHVIAAKTVTPAVEKKFQFKPKKNFVFINLNAQFNYNI